jgi:hypothetical protein
MTQKRIHEFKAGDIVRFHGARFRILADARPAYVSRIYDGCTIGASSVAIADGRWIDGHIEPGYFAPDLDWTFQGNFNAGRYTTE